MTIDINDTNSQIEHFTKSYPKSWVLAKIYAICEPINGKAFKSSDWKPDGLPIIRIKNLNNSEALFNYYQGKVEEKFKVYNGDLLFAWSGTPGTSFGAHIWNGKEAVLNQHIFNISFNQKLINSKYFCFALNHNVSRYIEQAQGGVGLAHITKSKFVSSSIPLPPLSEQNRIIAKIEELLTRLDAGIKSLKKVQILLNKYRQSVLKSAVEGKLTSKWRKQHKDELEPGDKLLERILKERKEKWEAEQLANFKAKGIKPPKDWKDKYKEPSPPDTSDLPELPEGWVWSLTSFCCNKIQDGTHFSPKVQYDSKAEGRYMYVTAKNIKESGVELSNITFIDEHIHRDIYKRCNVENDDVLLIKDGVKTGIATVNQLEEEFSLLSSVAFLKPMKSVLNPLYLKYFFNSPVGFDLVTGKMSGTAIRRIILQRIKETPVPISPIREQDVIVNKVEKKLTIIDENEKAVANEILRSNSLRKAILKQAFEGKLVPQDPNDEPASVLLERIKAKKTKLKN